MNYYQQLKEKLNNLLENNQYIEALAIVNEELSMPYIPLEFEDFLHNIKKECSIALNHDANHYLSANKIGEYLFSKNNDQLAKAIQALSEVNVRQYLELIQDALNSTSITDMTKVELIHILKQQQVNGLFSLTKNGRVFNFNTEDVYDLLNHCSSLITLNDLIDHVFDDNPSLAMLAKTMAFDMLVGLFPIQVSQLDDYRMVLERLTLYLCKANQIDDQYYLDKINDELISYANRLQAMC